MAALVCSVFFLFHTASSQLQYETLHTINWVETDAFMPINLQKSIQIYYDNHFIVFGGTSDTTGYNGRFYIGYTQPTPAPATIPTFQITTDPPSSSPTPSPTYTNEYISRARISHWNSSLTLSDIWDETFKLYSVICDGQCYSSTPSGTFFLTNDVPGCNEDFMLYRFDPSQLIYYDRVIIERYNLTQFVINTTYASSHYCMFSESQRTDPCVTTHSDTFSESKLVYMVLANKIFVYNVTSEEGYFSPSFTKQQQHCYADDSNNWDCDYQNDVPYSFGRSACTFDATGEYIWITDRGGGLWRYSVVTNTIFDVAQYTFNKTSGQPNVNGTLNKISYNDYSGDWVDPFYYYDNEMWDFSRMIPLSHGFILFTGTERDYILLPNVTEATDSWQYAASKTEYIDFVCAGRLHYADRQDAYWDWQVTNTPFFFDWPNQEVLSLGGTTFSNVEWVPQVCKGCTNTGQDRTDWRHSWTTNSTKQIRSYAWMRDFNLVINITQDISFGDDIDFNVYFEPTCDLSGYDLNGDEWTASKFNPLFFEIAINTNDPALELQAFMYIVNATGIEDRAGWDNTYVECFLCKNRVPLLETDWADEVTMQGLLATDGCIECVEGLPSGSIHESMAGIQYQLEFEVLNSPNSSVFTLDSEVRNFTMTMCQPGFGTTAGASTVDCNKCPFNQFTLVDGLDPCIPCDSVSEGLVCEGGNETHLTYNYWVAAWDYDDQDIKPFYEIEHYDDDDLDTNAQNDGIITSLCPPKYCCQVVSGCDYLSEYLKRPQRKTNYNGQGYYNANKTWVAITGSYDNNGTWHETDDYDYGSWSYWVFNETTSCYDCGEEYECCDSKADIAANGLLCAFGRDADVPLCGACLDGWAEVLGTTQCADCEHSSGWLFILFASFLLTMFLSYYIIFCDSKPVDFQYIKTKKKLMIQDDITGFQTLIFKPVLYYFQSINPILDTRGIKLWISPVVSFFNFSFDSIGDQDSEICWSEGLDATGEILINLLLPTLLMFHLLFPRLCIDRQGNGAPPCCCCCRKKKMCCCCCKSYQTPYFASAFFRVLLITIGVVLTVCFKYLTYVEIEDKKLLFYSADKEAFGGWWFGGFFGVLFVIVVFVVIYVKIKKQEPTQRYSTNSIYRKFVKSFRENFWYWEFVLFSRRFFISCFTSIQFVGGGYTNFIFLVILLAYLVANVHYKPFAYSRVNKIESLCLVLLIAAFVAANFIDIDDDDLFVGWMLSLCIMIPLVIVLFYGLKIVLHLLQWISFDDDNKMVNKKIEGIMKRMPKSFRDVMHKEMGGHDNLELEEVTQDNTAKNARHAVGATSEEYKDTETNNPTQTATVNRMEKQLSHDEVMLEAQLNEVLEEEPVEENK